MANTYEMKFQLSAAVGSGFNGTFSQAQKVLSETQKNMQSLQKQQGDIASYQKLQSAVESNNSKLKTYQAQLNNVQKEMKESGTFSSELANKELTLKGKIEETTKKIEDEEKAIGKLRKELEDNKIDVNNLEQAQEELSKSLKEQAELHEKAGAAAQEHGEKAEKSFADAGAALASAGLVNGLKKLYEAYMDCVSVASEFESGMSNVEALSGASSEEMAALTAQAKELGATTKFTAKQSSEAMGYMAMAGWDVQQMLEGMPAVLSLAAASGEDLGTVSDIVTDSLTAFGLKASDAGHYADLLAQTASKANTNVSLMGETFKYAAPLAGALGYSADDVAVAVGMMANACIKGSEAGSTLRNILTRLAKPTKESSDAMEALGISLTDSEGNMLSFGDMVVQMREGFAGLNEKQKAFYAAELGGQRAMSGLLAIVNSSEEDFANLTSEVNNCTGAAQKMADIKLDNLAGDMTIMQSAVDGLKISLGEKLNPELREGTQTMTEILTQVNQFIDENPELVRGILTTVGTFGGIIGGIAGITAAAKACSVAMGLLSASIPGLNVILGVAAALSIVSGAVMCFNDQAEKAKKAEIDKMFGDISFSLEECQEIAERMVRTRAMEHAAKAFEEFEKLEDINKEFESFQKTINKTNWKVEAGLTLKESEINDYKNALQGYVDNVQAYIEQQQYAVSLGVSMTFGDDTDTSKNITQVYNAVMGGLSAELNSLGTELAKQVNDAFKDGFLDINDTELISETLAKIQDIKNRIADSQMQAKLDLAEFNAGGLTYDTYNTINEESWKIIDEFSEQAKTTFEETVTAYRVAMDEAERAYAENQDEASKKAWEDAQNAYNTIFEQGYEGLVDAKVKEQIEREFNNLNKISGDTISTLQDDMQELERAKTQYGENSDEYKEALQRISDDQKNMTAAEERVFEEFMADTNEHIESLRSEYEKALANGETEVVESLQGIIDLYNALTAAANGFTGMSVSNVTTKANVDEYGHHAGTATTRTFFDASTVTTATGGFKKSVAGKGGEGKYRKYASGIISAFPGYALTGENGPELINFAGGETVYNHTRTNRFLSGAEMLPNTSNSVVIAPVINIEGNADSDAVERMTDIIVDKIIEKVEEAGIDARRRAYA